MRLIEAETVRGMKSEEIGHRSTGSDGGAVEIRRVEVRLCDLGREERWWGGSVGDPESGCGR